MKVRFNLGHPNYRMWKVTGKDIAYYNPELHSLLMFNCVLKNRFATALKIYDGAEKSVCAWVSCEFLYVYDGAYPLNLPASISYNPRIKPYWTDGENNLDGAKFQRIISVGRELFVE